MKIKSKEEEWMRKIEDYKEKLEKVEKALNAKTVQLFDHLQREC